MTTKEQAIEPTQELLKPTQADRDAAAILMDDMYNDGHPTDLSRELAGGKRDGHHFVQAFAKHRLAHQPQPVDVERLIERAIDHARRYGTREGDARRKYTPAQMEIAVRAALTAIKPQPVDVEKMSVSDEEWLERRVYKSATDEYRLYLGARFPRTGGAPSPFDFDGHKWAYYVTSFDDKGEYDVIRRRVTKAAITATQGAGGEGWYLVREVHDNFAAALRQGYKTADKIYAVEMLSKALAAMPAKSGEEV